MQYGILLRPENLKWVLVLKMGALPTIPNLNCNIPFQRSCSRFEINSYFYIYRIVLIFCSHCQASARPKRRIFN